MTIPEHVRLELLELSAGTLAETYFDRFIHLVRPAIRCKNTCRRGAEQVGMSRIGGRPDVPDDWRWPHLSGVPLQFMAQFRLDDLGGFWGTESLPERGLLSLFYVSDPFTASCREELAAARVYHFHDVDLKPALLPAEFAGRSEVWNISFEQIWSVPDDEHHFAARELYAALSEEDRQELREELVWLGDCGSPLQLLGYPSREQEGCLQLQCERLFRGLSWTDIDSPSIDLIVAAAEWELLAQVTFDWAPVFRHDGYLHYWIRNRELKIRDFSQVCYTFERS